MQTPKEVISFIKDRNIKIVDLRFTDLPGLWHHFSMLAKDFTEDLFEEGVGFDGSSIRGFKTIEASDMILMPDPITAFQDPFTAVPTLNIICNVKDPVTLEMYSRDPRYIAQKAENYLISTGIADKAFFGPEAEFFILDGIRFDQSYNCGYYYIESKEGFWDSGKEEGAGEPADGSQTNRQSSGYTVRNGPSARAGRCPLRDSSPRGCDSRSE